MDTMRSIKKKEELNNVYQPLFSSIDRSIDALRQSRAQLYEEYTAKLACLCRHQKPNHKKHR